MSDKYLTVKEWQKFSAERAYKDTPAGKAMVKALGEAEKAADAPPAEQLRILEELEAAGRELLKLYKGDKKLLSYLEDVYKPLKKYRKSAEKTQAKEEKAEAKAAGKAASKEDEDEGEDEEGSSALLDPKRLLAQLTLCKKSPDRRVHFAYVDGKDKEPAVLAVSPKVAGRRLFALLSEEFGVKVGSFGLAWVDGTELMVQPDKPLGGLAKKMRAPIKECGFRATKIILVTADGSVLEQEDAPDDEQGDASTSASAASAESAAQPAPATPPPAGNAGAEFTARLKALLPKIAAAAATKEGQAAKLLAGEAGGLARKGDFAAGMTALDALSKLLAGAAPAPVAPPDPAAPLADLKRRLAILVPQAKAALQAGGDPALRQMSQEAVVLAQQGDAPGGHQLLDRLEALLPSFGGKTGGESSGEVLASASQGWTAARLHALAELGRLRQVFESAYGGVSEEAQALAGALAAIEAAQALMDDGLDRSLGRLLALAPSQRREAADEARSMIARCRSEAEADLILSSIDGNEYAPDMAVASPLLARLQDLEAAL